ncbi:hypothetical protein, partial [Streptomyces zaomyceticus]|uniref:hypothetical protein n=1 Tax=Streptomyces zaomyceticus TaxID=68286 RepID=UPI00343EAA1E
HIPLRGICPGKPGHRARIAQAQFEFRRKRRNGIPQAELKGETIRASANCGHPRKRGRLGWQ